MSHRAKAEEFEIMLCGARVKIDNKEAHFRNCKDCRKVSTINKPTKKI